MISFGLHAKEAKKERKPTEMSIFDAMDKGLLQIELQGYFDPKSSNEIIDKEGVHYGKCISVYIHSKIDSFILIRLDAGVQLLPDDTVYQRMIVTKKVIFPLYPNQAYPSRIYAMCGQLHHQAPLNFTIYKLGEMADSSTIRLANYIGDNYLQNMIGQHAVWAYTDNATADELIKYGADSLTIFRTKEILDNVHLETKLNPHKATVPVPVIPPSRDVTLSRYVLYAGGILIIALLASTVILIVIRNKKPRPNA